MKIVLIKNNFVIEETVFSTIEEAKQKIQDDNLLILEAEDCVCSGWGFINEKFIKPTPPEGWTYINEVNCFAPIDIEERKKLNMRIDI